MSGEPPAEAGESIAPLGFARPLDLADPNLKRLIIRLAVPSVAGLSINALHQVVNAGFVGMLGSEALAAVSVAIPVFALIAALGHGIGVGAAAAIGRLLGAGDKASADATATMALGLAVVAGFGCSLVLLFAREPILQLFGASPAMMPQASAYLGLLGFGCILLLLQIACDFIAIAEGNTRFSMLTLLGGFTLNIALDPLLIFGFGLGVSGAALATILAQLAALAAYAVYFARRWGVVRIRLRLLKPTMAILRPVLAVGLPVTLSSALSAVGYALIYRAANAYGGDEAVAGVGIAFRILSLGALPVVGFCLGAQAVLSHGYGANDPRRVLEASRFMLRLALGFTLAYAMLMALAAGPVIALFTQDETTRRIGMPALIVFHAGFALSGFQYVLLVLLQAQGKARLAACVSLAPQGYLLLPLLIWLPPLWGLNGLLASPAIASGLTALAAAILLLGQFAVLRRRAGLSPDSIQPLPVALAAGETARGSA